MHYYRSVQEANDAAPCKIVFLAAVRQARFATCNDTPSGIVAQRPGLMRICSGQPQTRAIIGAALNDSIQSRLLDGDLGRVRCLAGGGPVRV